MSSSPARVASVSLNKSLASSFAWWVCSRAFRLPRKWLRCLVLCCHGKDPDNESDEDDEGKDDDEGHDDDEHDDDDEDD